MPRWRLYCGITKRENRLAAMLISVPDYEAYKVNVWVGWVSPLNHATFYMHNFGLDMLPRLWQSYLICIVLVLVCFIAALWVVRGYNFKFTGTGGK